MKDNPFLFVLILFCSVVIISSFLSIGEYMAKNNDFSRCIKYHENLSVVEANKTCNAILKGTTK